MLEIIMLICFGVMAFTPNSSIKKDAEKKGKNVEEEIAKYKKVRIIGILMFLGFLIKIVMEFI